MENITLVSKVTGNKITGEQFINWLHESNKQGKLYIKSGVLHVSATPAQHQTLTFVSASVLKPLLLERFMIDVPTAFIIAGAISAEFGGIPSASSIAKTSTAKATPTAKDAVDKAIEFLQSAGNTKLTKAQMLAEIKIAISLLEQARG